MNNPMVIAAENVIVDFLSEKGAIEAEVTEKETQSYEYCFMGISLTPEQVVELKTAMQADSQFYIEIMFKDVVNFVESEETKYVHQFFDYAVLVDQAENLELKMDGYYELPLDSAITTVKVLGAKVYFVEKLLTE